MIHLISQYVFWISLGLLLYTQAIYGLLVILLARFRSVKRPAKSGNIWPVVTLVIPAHNEAKVIESKLRNSLELDYPENCLRILVASDGSTDNTNDISDSMTNHRITLKAFSARRGKASVINDAVGMATSDIVCLCDANVMFHPTALQRLVEWFEDPSVGAVTGDVRLASEEANFGEGESAYYSLEKRIQQAESRLGSVMGVDGGMYAMRRQLFQPLPPDTILDDFVTSIRVLRQSARVVYEPSAIATENGTPTARQEFRRRVRVAAGAVQSLKRREWPRIDQWFLWWQYLSHKLLRWLGPVWMLLLICSNIILFKLHGFFQLTLGAQCLFYFVAALGFFSVAWRKTRVGGVTFYFVLSHLAMTAGILRGMFNRQSVTWRQAERSISPTPYEHRSPS